ncbi:hypothetical protein JK358_38205 [Nocardia sp. 2]|uniref:Molybdopterin synthase sulfur carrier subunit n=1 Tax=Nocardia acididurans TaxID=2802282 RepID=A0ABS1MJM1_9NOCA|nr:hypothetical protein [Nocardia acididurans]MBL1080245.1 hypothetical protein [Nocardia acididurans]
MSGQVRFILSPNWSTLAGRTLDGLECEADTVGQALHWLREQCPTLADRILSADGQLTRFSTYGLDGEKLAGADALTTVISEGGVHELQIVPAFMGG